MASTSFVNLVTLTDAEWFNKTDGVAYSYLTSVAGADTITATGPVSMTAYAAGQKFHFIPAATNTGATTANITPSGGAALGAKNIFNRGVACVGGEIQISVPCVIEYDGTQFNLINPQVLKGTVTNDSAGVGLIGEYVSATVLAGSAVSLTTTTAADVTSISLTAGDWDVSGNVAFKPAASTTCTLIAAWISTTSATPPTQPNSGAYSRIAASLTNGGEQSLTMGTIRISLAATTTVYLSGISIFAVSTNTVYGFIGARRAR